MLNREESGEINQTEFVDQAAFLDEEKRMRPSIEEIKKNKNLLPFYILIGVIVLLVLIFVLAAVFGRRNLDEKETQTIEEVYEDLDPLTQRVRSLEQDLEKADPTRQSLPFPQVDLEFNID